MDIYFGTILVEPHRWKDAPPATLASVWIDRALAAGFDGIELWERHFLACPPGEQSLLAARAGKVRVYNSYARFDAASAVARTESMAGCARFAAGVRGVKFNLGRPPSDPGPEIAEAAQFLDALPDGVGGWCECHEGTHLEKPDAAAVAFAGWGLKSAAILHPVGMSADRMRAWFDAAQNRVAHLHLQARGPEGRFTSIRNRPAEVQAAFERLRTLGFAGSATIEFATGVATPDEDPARVFEQAVADLAFLRREVGA